MLGPVCYKPVPSSQREKKSEEVCKIFMPVEVTAIYVRKMACTPVYLLNAVFGQPTLLLFFTD